MRKDYVSTFDGTLASLSAPTRLVYLLILKRKAHKDNKYCKKDQFFHSVENISEASGYKTRAVKYALKELRDLEVIDWTERPGRSTLYTHKKYITIYTPKNYTNEKYTPENPRISCTPANTSIPCTPPMHQVHPTYAPHAPITTKDLTNKDLTTTDWLSDKLLDRLIKEYTIEAINERVVAIKKGTETFIERLDYL